MTIEDKVLCETPTAGKQPTRIDRWKYDAVRSAILRVLPTQAPGLPFKLLPAAVADVLGSEQLQKLGSVAWYTTSVKLDMEVKGEIRRSAGSGPQTLVRVR